MRDGSMYVWPIAELGWCPQMWPGFNDGRKGDQTPPRRRRISAVLVSVGKPIRIAVVATYRMAPSSINVLSDHFASCHLFSAFVLAIVAAHRDFGVGCVSDFTDETASVADAQAAARRLALPQHELKRPCLTARPWRGRQRIP